MRLFPGYKSIVGSFLLLFIVASSYVWSWEPDEDVEGREDYETYFQAACRLGRVDVIQYYLGRDDFDVNQSFTAGDAAGKTGLFVALENGHRDAVSLLLSRNGIVVDRGSENGFSVLDKIKEPDFTQFADLFAPHPEITILSDKDDEDKIGGEVYEDEDEDEDEDEGNLLKSLSVQGVLSVVLNDNSPNSSGRSSPSKEVENILNTASDSEKSEDDVSKNSDERKNEYTKPSVRFSTEGFESLNDDTGNWKKDKKHTSSYVTQAGNGESDDTGKWKSTTKYKKHTSSYVTQAGNGESHSEVDALISEITDTVGQLSLDTSPPILTTPFEAVNLISAWHKSSTEVTNDLLKRMAFQLQQKHEEFERQQTTLDALDEQLSVAQEELDNAQNELERVKRKLQAKERIEIVVSPADTLRYSPPLESGFVEEPFKKVEGENTFFTACKDGHVDAVTQFTEDNPELLDHPFPTLLVRSDDKSKKVAVRGAGPETKNATTATGMFVASANGNDGVVKKLIEKGADRDIVAGTGDTPLSIAVKNHHWNVVDSLLSVDFPTIEKIFSTSPTYQRQIVYAFELACNLNDYETVEAILARKLVDVNILMRERVGTQVRVKTGLHITATYGHVEATQVLLKYEANPYALRGILSGSGQEPEIELIENDTPLVLASREGHEQMVALLLEGREFDADQNESDIQPVSVRQAMQTALQKNHFPFVSALHKQTPVGFYSTPNYPEEISAVNGLAALQLQWRYQLACCRDLNSAVDYHQTSVGGYVRSQKGPVEFMAPLIRVSGDKG